jgi:hypothetical protein
LIAEIALPVRGDEHQATQRQTEGRGGQEGNAPTISGTVVLIARSVLLGQDSRDTNDLEFVDEWLVEQAPDGRRSETGVCAVLPCRHGAFVRDDVGRRSRRGRGSTRRRGVDVEGSAFALVDATRHHDGQRAFLMTSIPSFLLLCTCVASSQRSIRLVLLLLLFRARLFETQNLLRMSSRRGRLVAGCAL